MAGGSKRGGVASRLARVASSSSAAKAAQGSSGRPRQAAKQAAPGLRQTGCSGPGRAGVWWLPCCARAGHTASYAPVHPAASPDPHSPACHRRRRGRYGAYRPALALVSRQRRGRANAQSGEPTRLRAQSAKRSLTGDAGEVSGAKRTRNDVSNVPGRR